MIIQFSSARLSLCFYKVKFDSFRRRNLSTLTDISCMLIHQSIWPLEKDFSSSGNLWTTTHIMWRAEREKKAVTEPDGPSPKKGLSRIDLGGLGANI